ncbi:hypothetical protein TU82_09490 [Pseudomonas orientalis]|nr:hypothetical protein TU82_09490 [Pseudomonas orientalis]
MTFSISYINYKADITANIFIVMRDSNDPYYSRQVVSKKLSYRRPMLDFFGYDIFAFVCGKY